MIHYRLLPYKEDSKGKIFYISEEARSWLYETFRDETFLMDAMVFDGDGWAVYVTPEQEVLMKLKF